MLSQSYSNLCIILFLSIAHPMRHILFPPVDANAYSNRSAYFRMCHPNTQSDRVCMPFFEIPVRGTYRVLRRRADDQGLCHGLHQLLHRHTQCYLHAVLSRSHMQVHELDLQQVLRWSDPSRKLRARSASELWLEEPGVRVSPTKMLSPALQRSCPVAGRGSTIT